MGRIIQIKRGPKSTMPTLSQGELAMTTDSGSEGLFIGTGMENIELARKSDLDTIPIPDVSGQIGTHNSDSSAHSDIRESITTHTGDTSVHVTTEEKAAWNAKADAPFKPEGKSYLMFSSPSSFTIAVNDTTKHWDGTLDYFTSDRTWTVWDGTTTLSAVDNDGEYVLYLRGTGNTVITGTSSNYKWVITGTDISCIGNIENLLDYATVKSGVHPTMADRCYQHMFRDCTSLTQAPALPATTSADRCYTGMFQGCTALTKAPALPATTLATNCYYNMFQGCTALTQAPALPATTLVTNCYYNMFQGCTSLKLSSSKTDEYTQEYRVPSSGTGITADNALTGMFDSTGGTFTGTPGINTTYYLSSDNMVVYETEIATLNEYVGSIAAPASHASDEIVHITDDERNSWNAKLDSYTETDPTVPAWAKAASKPSYTASEVGADPSGSASQALTDAKSYTDTQIAAIPTPDVSGQIGTHNSDSSAHSDIRESITMHTGDASIHVTVEEKTAWDAKANEIPITNTPDDNVKIWIDPDEDDQTESFYTKAETDTLLQNKAATPKSVSVTLAVESWDPTTKAQTVTVTGVSATETDQMITPVPAMASQSAYYDAGILCTRQAANSLTFTCKTVPTADLTVYVIIQEVGA